MIYRFHYILIGSAIAFGLLMAGYQVVQYTRDGTLETLLIGGLFLVISVTLTAYLTRMIRQRRSATAGSPPR